MNPQLIPIKKDADTIRKTVLTNVVKMFVSRENIFEDKAESAIKRVLEYKSENNIYKIDLDVPIKNAGSSDTYEGKSVMVNIMAHKVTATNKFPAIKEFLENNQKHHKILIFDEVSDKAKHSIENTHNTEVFIESYFMICLAEYTLAPKYKILTEDEVQEVLKSYNVTKNQLKKIMDTDPYSLYYNAKRGQVFRIICNSEQTGKSVGYRIVVKGNITKS
jgi:DNA-directed RNA polymerase subunit H (RpoH/RPB5)